MYFAPGYIFLHPIKTQRSLLFVCMAFILMVGDSRVLRWREECFKLDLPVSVHSLPSANLEKIQDRVDAVLGGHIDPNLHLYPLQARPGQSKNSKPKQKALKRRKSSYEECVDSLMSSLAQSNPQCAQLEYRSKSSSQSTSKSVCVSPKNENIRAIVVFGFLYDFLFRTVDVTTKSGKGLTKATPSTCTQHFRTLLQKVKTITKEWQDKVLPSCKIIWTLPYPFDFLLYNNLFLEKVHQDPVSSREEHSMKKSTKEFMHKLMILRRLWLNLMPLDVMFFDLNLLDGADDKPECNRVKCPRNITPGLLFPSSRRVNTFNGFLNSFIQRDAAGANVPQKFSRVAAATSSSSNSCVVNFESTNPKCIYELTL